MLTLDEQGVADLVQGAPIHTDARPVLDFTTNAAIPPDVVERNLARIAELRTFAGRYVTANESEVDLIQQYDRIARSLFEGHLAILRGRTDDGARAYRDAYRLEAGLGERLGTGPLADTARPLW